MDKTSRREIMLHAEGLDEAIHAHLVDDILRDIREGRYDSNTRLKREWLITAGDEMERIEKAGLSFILMGVLAAVFSLGMLGFLGKWLLGVALAGIMLAAVWVFHRRLAYLALRIGRTQHLVNELLSYGKPIEGEEQDVTLAAYVNAQTMITLPQWTAITRYRGGGDERLDKH